MPADETPCYSLEAERPALIYAVRRKPSPKQAAMCRTAVELHMRIDRLPTGETRGKISQSVKADELTLVVNAFAVGGVQQNCDVQSAMDQLTSVQKRVFSDFFAPALWDAKQRFVLSFIGVALVGALCALAAARFAGWTEVSNYLWFVMAAAFGVTIVSAGTGLHYDFSAYDDDMIALQRPLIRIFLGSGVALVIALALSTGAATLKFGTMSTTDVPTKTTVALALGSLLGIANAEAFRLIVRFASQAINRVSVAGRQG